MKNKKAANTSVCLSHLLLMMSQTDKCFKR